MLNMLKSSFGFFEYNCNMKTNYNYMLIVFNFARYVRLKELGIPVSDFEKSISFYPLFLNHS